MVRGPRYRVDVIAYDAAAPTKQTIQRLEVIVTEVNQPPILEGTSLGPISPGSLAQIPFAATDRDRPANGLEYRLINPSDSAMKIHPTTGLLTWQTSIAHANRSFPIVVEVMDDGQPRMSHRRTVTLAVAPIIDPRTWLRLQTAAALMKEHALHSSDRIGSVRPTTSVELSVAGHAIFTQYPLECADRSHHLDFQ